MVQYQLSTSAVQSKANGGLSLKREKMITQFICDHLGETLQVLKLAEICCLSRSHFSRAFKISTGLSPQSWILNQRLKHARKLMQYTQKSLTQISFECGFSDQSHFCHNFFRNEGVNPLAWRCQVSKRDSQVLMSEGDSLRSVIPNAISTPATC
jgi:AraC-like DNA-binding protein